LTQVGWFLIDRTGAPRWEFFHEADKEDAPYGFVAVGLFGIAIVYIVDGLIAGTAGSLIPELRYPIFKVLHLPEKLFRFSEPSL